MSIEGGLGGLGGLGGGGGIGMPGAHLWGRPLPPPTSSSYSYSDIANHHRHPENNDDIKCRRPSPPNDAAAAAVGNAHRADVATNDVHDEAMRPRPKRPLSAFNLFYRYKRRRILQYISKSESSSSNNVVDRDAIIRIVGAVPGLEGAEEDGGDDGGRKDRVRERVIRSELTGINLLPRDNRDRQHRTDESAMNGAMSFVELGRAMNASWKDCDALARSIFDDLAEEGRRVYQGRLKEYLDGQNGSAGVVECRGDGTSAIVVGGDDWKEKEKKGTAGRGKRASATTGTTKRKRPATAASKKRTKKEVTREEDVVGELGDVDATGDNDDDHVPEKRLAEAASGALDAHRIHRHPPTGTVVGPDLRTVSVDHSISSSFSSSMSSAGMDCQDAGTSATASAPPIIHHQHHRMRYHHPPPAQGQGGGSEVWYAHPRYHHQRQYHHYHNQHPSIVGNGGIGIVDDVQLHRRVMDLDGQLAFDRLNNRVVELEGELSRRIVVERQLRTRIDELMMMMSSSYGGGGADAGSSGERALWSAGMGLGRMPPAAHFSPASSSSSSVAVATDHPPVRQRQDGGAERGSGNGLWSLVSAMDCVGRTASAFHPAGPISSIGVARADRHHASDDGSPD